MKVQIKCAESLKVKQISAGRHNADREKGKFVCFRGGFLFLLNKASCRRETKNHVKTVEAHVHKKHFYYATYRLKTFLYVMLYRTHTLDGKHFYL